MAKGAEHSASFNCEVPSFATEVRLQYGTGSWLKFTILLWKYITTFLLRNADEVGVIFDLFEFVALNFGMLFAIKSF